MSERFAPVAFTRFGDQPALLVIYDRGLTIRQVAEKVSESAGEQVAYFNLYKCLRGQVAIHPTLREHLPKALGLSETECFTADALAAPFRFIGAERIKRGA